MKTVVSIVGIRPDFIRMSSIFKKLDQNFHHVLVHTGQHYDRFLSDIFFEEFGIRKPDFNLEIGGKGYEHYHQLATLSVESIHLLIREKINPDIILFLGDSNSVVASVPLKKEGYKIGHIEAGMRSYDKRMLEEINRVVCDHCSDLLFVYHPDYMANLVNENVDPGSIHIVGNTIVEVCAPFISRLRKNRSKNRHILLDIHRPENFRYVDRLKNIIKYANICHKLFKVPVKMLEFGRTYRQVFENKLDIGGIKFIDLMPYTEFIQAQYDSLFIISDSGTSQEEPALFEKPVIVPRDFTERPQSVAANCSFMLDVNSCSKSKFEESFDWLESLRSGTIKMDKTWLGDGSTSNKIIDILKERL